MESYYAMIKNGLVTNVVFATLEFVQDEVNQGRIDEFYDLGEGPRPSPGDTYEGDGVFTPTYPDLALVKAQKLSDFQADIDAYIRDRYTINQRFQLLVLYTIAKEEEKTTRAAYLRQMLDWGNSFISYANTIAALVNSKVTPEDVLAVSWDIRSNTLADPLVRAGVAIQIPN
jgi:hypothetical protein